MKATEKKATELAVYFEYLDELRESGVTNMFGAGLYLRHSYTGMSIQDASKVLTAWMKTFNSDMTPSDRAEEAIRTELW